MVTVRAACIDGSVARHELMAQAAHVSHVH